MSSEDPKMKVKGDITIMQPTVVPNKDGNYIVSTPVPKAVSTPVPNRPDRDYDEIKRFLEQIPKDKCDIKFQSIHDNLQNMANMLQPTNWDKNKMVGVILNDTFYNSVNELAKNVSNVKVKNLECLSKNKEELCRPINSYDRPIKNLDISDLEISIKILTKYAPIIKDLYSNMMMNLMEYASYCGNDANKIKKIHELIAKLANVMSDNRQMKEICDEIHKKNPNIQCPKMVCRVEQFEGFEGGCPFNMRNIIKLILVAMILYIIYSSCK
jgi:hypothetical protein